MMELFGGSRRESLNISRKSGNNMSDDFDPPTLVTGAAGFVGNNLVCQLLEIGRRVRVLVRHPKNDSLRGLEVETCIGDVLQPASLDAAMKGVSSVFHLAGSISIDGQSNSEMKRVNVEGTANVVQSCLKTDVKRLVHFSSIHALSTCRKTSQLTSKGGWPPIPSNTSCMTRAKRTVSWRY